MVMAKIRNALDVAGVEMEGTVGEYGVGQQEINLCYTDALEMADRHVVLKQAVHEIVEREGWSCTFMAKYNDEHAGSSCHIHNSLWEAGGSGKSLFHDPNDKKYGMSKLMRHWLAGQMRYAREYSYFLAPYINSYKRFVAGSWAPTKVAWAPDNRTTAFRVCGIGPKHGSSALRVECRIGGADLNPYLAFAALIAAGLAGIDQELELPTVCEGNAYNLPDGDVPEVPKTLREAIQTLASSDMLKKALGQEVLEHYVTAAEWEQSVFDRQVTDWELERGFDRA